MGTIAEKLTYLNTTKEKIRDSINLTGANIGTSDTFRSYASKLKKGYIDIINNGIDTLYNNFPKVSGIGSNLSLTPTYEAPMKLNEIIGDTKQTTYTGKNYFTTNYIVSGSATINDEEKNDFTISKKWADLFMSKENTIKAFKPSTTYTLSCKYKILTRPSSFGVNNNNRVLGLFNGSNMVDILVAPLKTTGNLNTWYDYSRTFTTPSDLTDYYGLAYTFKDENNATTGSIELTELQIEENSTATSFEPYVGSTAEKITPSPNPDYPQEIQSVTGLQNIEVCGKNLLKNQGINQTINGITFTKNEDGSITASGTATATAFYNMSEFTLPAGTYNISQGFQGTSGYYLQLVERVSGTPVIANISSRTNRTFTLSEQKNLRVNFRIANGTTIDNLIAFPMIEQGSTETEYEPYKGNNYEVNLGKNLCNNALFVADSGATINSYTDNSISVTFVGTYKAATQFINISNSIYTFSIGNISKNKGRMEVYLYNNGEQVGTKQNVTANQTYTIDNTSGLGDQIRLTLSNSDLTQTNEITFDNIQLEKGTQATSFSPYFTPIELNKIGDYQDSIKKSSGKNIITTYNYASSGYINYNYDNSKIGKTMTYSFIPNFSTTNASLYIRANTSISSYKVGTIATITSGTKVSVTFTLTDEQYNTIKNTTGGYIQVYKSGVSMDENSISNPMLEINSQSTSYEPYGKVWYIEKQIGKVVLDGSEEWFNWSNNRMVLATLTDYKKVDSSTTSLLMSNYYKAVSRANSQTNNSMCFYGSSDDSFGIIVCDGTNNTSTLLKAWLLTHNTSVYYVLATPTYTEITNTELIEDLEILYTAKSQEGTTNISITSEDLEMILNVSALKSE